MAWVKALRVVLGLAAALVGACARAAEATGEEGFRPIFDGATLAGWDGKPGWWRVEDGSITAESTPEHPCTKHNYLMWRGGRPADFELRLKFRLQGGNSGVQFRSRELPDWDTSGYQADMDADDTYTGGIYEHARGVIAPRGQSVVIATDGARKVSTIGDFGELRKVIRDGEWNDYRIVARGPEMTLYINGKLTAHAEDHQSGLAASRGVLAFQMHPGPPMKVQFKDIRLKEYADENRGSAGATPAERIRIAKDFKVELLYSPPSVEGSWASMCVDPKGRLIVSDQYDAGLYRVTPPPVGTSGVEPKVEKLPVDLSGAQGLLWAFDSLYVMVSKNGRYESGLYRVTSSPGTDSLDRVERLRLLEGGGDHGWHGLVAGPDGRSIYVVAGNATKVRHPERSRVPLDWGEDHLLPRLPDARGFMTDVLAPGGCIYRVNPEGTEWELVASGFRNPYDAAFHRNGDLITFDADMEWDMNTPWYRPTRLCLVASGAEFGWRNGAGKWPEHHPDSLPPIHNVGPGSPVGLAFGYGAKFPAKYQEALFMPDWSYGRMLVAHLSPDGAGYKAETELFMSAAPLPLTDLVVSPTDGAMYLITGGWRIQTGLYRITYTGGESTAEVHPADRGASAREIRRRLEAFHGRRTPEAVGEAWPHLGSNDRYLRFAARVALEWQDPAEWRERAFREKDPATALSALLALVRVSASDPQHRTNGAPAPDRALGERIVDALDRLPWARLTGVQKVDLLRTLGVAFVRFGPPDEERRAALAEKFDRVFPAVGRELNSELCQMLAYLQSPELAGKAMGLAERAATQEEAIDYIKSLRVLRVGWAQELRERYFQWFNKAAGFRGGASFAGFMNRIKADATATLTAEEKAALAKVLEAKPAALTPLQTLQQGLAGHSFVKEWTVDDLAAKAERALRRRDFDRGRKLFGALGCFACHRFANEGGALGPDLTSAGGRFSPHDLLESIIEPSKAISDLYAAMVINVAGGEALTGRIVYLGTDTVQVNTDMLNPSDTTSVKRSDILSIETSKVSPMPTGLLNVLAEDEIYDLLAYVLSGGDSGHPMFRAGR
jgi:putative heme-binding domain-containing protein